MNAIRDKKTPQYPEIKPGQSIELLKALHILTRDGAMNQDSRRKLKQVYHLCQFIEPLIEHVRLKNQGRLHLVDHGAGKAYLGFVLYDLYLKNNPEGVCITGVETRQTLVEQSRELAKKLGFEKNMQFVNTPAAQAIDHPELPQEVDMVTALHACNTATDDAIAFGLRKKATCMALVPCCQAEIATELRRTKGLMLGKTPLVELWRHPIHTREFGSQLTNVLRCLQLEAHGYQLTVTELVGWEHAMKNELIVAKKHQKSNPKAGQKLLALLETLGLECLKERFFLPDETTHSPD